ncbi:MAG: aldo/keto reductase [bacterium]|nr:aldo/keto reductase [bacterium]
MKRREFIVNSALLLAGSTMLGGCGENPLIVEPNEIVKKKYKNMAIPLLGFGCMRLPLKDKQIDVAEVERMVDYAIKHGANYFDTAYMYMDGKSENVIGKILKQYKRSDIIIADKSPIVFMNSKDDVKRIFEQQLKEKVDTDYFDFYMVHNINSNTYDNYKNFEVYKQLLDFKRQGLIKNLGFSYHGDIKMLNDVVKEHKWDFCQLQMNYFDWESGVNSKEQYEIATGAKLPIIVMEPLRGGNLCSLPTKAVTELKAKMPNETQASYALKWIAGKSGILTVLSGMSNLQQMKENIATFENFKPLTKDEEALSERIVSIIRQESEIACTSCRYCLELCPNGIAIPKIFSLYNQYKRDKKPWLLSTYYNNIPENARADKCTQCGLCKTNCPQNLDIPTLLKKIDKEVKSIKL